MNFQVPFSLCCAHSSCQPEPAAGRICVFLGEKKKIKLSCPIEQARGRIQNPAPSPPLTTAGVSPAVDITYHLCRSSLRDGFKAHGSEEESQHKCSQAPNQVLTCSAWHGLHLLISSSVRAAGSGCLSKFLSSIIAPRQIQISAKFNKLAKVFATCTFTLLLKSSLLWTKAFIKSLVQNMRTGQPN